MAATSAGAGKQYHRQQVHALRRSGPAGRGHGRPGASAGASLW